MCRLCRVANTPSYAGSCLAPLLLVTTSMKISNLILVLATTLSITACSKKADIQSTCDDVYAHGEKDGTWSPCKGDKPKFMEVCLKATPEVARCSSMEHAFDKDCEDTTGFKSETGFHTKMQISAACAGR